MREIVMTALQAGMRLDHFLERSLREAHTGFIYKMLRKKNITLNGHKAHGNEKLEAGDVVRLYFAGETLEKLCAGAVPGVEVVPVRNHTLSAERPCTLGSEVPGRKGSGREAPGREAPGREVPGREAPGRKGSGREMSAMGGKGQKEKVLTFPDFPSSVRILYEDEHVLLVCKPAGMLTQKAKPEDLSLNEYAIGYLLREGAITQRELQTVRPSVCNRLDRNTSGIVAIGKTMRGLQALSALFRDRTVSKHYQALVCGEVKSGQRIDGWLVKDERTNTVRILSREEKGAQRIRTSYTPEQAVCLTKTPRAFAGKEYPGGADGTGSQKRRLVLTLLDVDLLTGRSHQIRAHLASVGHPVAGDPKYGDAGVNAFLTRQFGVRRQLLHAGRLTFPVMDPPLDKLSGRTFTAPLPADFRRVMGEG